MSDRIAIANGFFRESDHAYIDSTGLRVPSTTQVLSILGLVDYSYIKEEVLARKSAIGVATHAAVQFLCEGTLDWDTVPQESINYVVAAENWINDQEFTSEIQEGQGIAEISGMKFGYAYDNIGSMMYKGRRRKVVLDYKTCVSASKAWKLQGAAYALAAPKLSAGERYLRCFLQLKPDGKSVPHYFEDRNDEAAWPHILFSCIWGLNNGLYSLDK